MRRFTTSILPLFVFLTLAACSKDRKAREWKAEDHDQPGEDPAAVAPAAAAPGPADVDDVYRSTCAPCHGANGQGDGPMGRSLRVADLSSPSWQQRVSDDDIADVIAKGRGNMPAFNMPPDKVQALVKKVRSFRK